jgi:(p)ppGpp synthase/HD superfamily hydrolase
MFHVKGYKEKIVALLHDIVEDTNLTIDDLEKYKFPNDILFAINTLTKKKGTRYDLYIDNLNNCEIARKVKIEDIKHNMCAGRLKNITDKDLKRIEKYKHSLQILTREK